MLLMMSMQMMAICITIGCIKMIKETLELLRLKDYYGKSELIDIAKGKYKVPMTIKEGLENSKRRK